MVLLDVSSFNDFKIQTLTQARNLPIGAIVFFLVTFGLGSKLDDSKARKYSFAKKLKHLDPLGIILLLGAVSCLFLALQWGGDKYAWQSAKIIGLLVGFVLLITTFGGLQWWLVNAATIPPRLLRERTVSCGALALFLISMSSNAVRIRQPACKRWDVANKFRNCISYHSSFKLCKECL